MTIKTLLQEARKTWGNQPMELGHIAIAMGVVYGDICRQARNQKQQQPIDEKELKKELGNLIYSCIRWCDDLGYKPDECIELAKKAQKRYAASL
jgi:hypothetical protein